MRRNRVLEAIVVSVVLCGQCLGATPRDRMSGSSSCNRCSAAPSSGNAPTFCNASPPCMAQRFSPRGGLRSKERLERGYTLILPGVLGHGPWDDQVAQGLWNAKIATAIEIYDWTRGPHMLAVNIFDNQRKQHELRRITAKIIDYQRRYPGRPVYLVGHSGGGSMAIKTLESLPPGRRVTSAILLAPGVSHDYDLSVAQAHTVRGIHSFYSPYDVLIAGTFSSAVGTFDGKHTLSAALVGFQTPQKLNPAARERYERSLVQHRYSSEMISAGHPGGHFGWTSTRFVSQQLAPLIVASARPQPTLQASYEALEEPPE
jgi:pimeloyl-ACP methyl ester carboxylesterase